jgi:hypothetical protein
MAITGNHHGEHRSALGQLFKKTQTGMLTALQDQTPELKWLRKTPMASLIPSGLEMRLILNVMFQGGGQMIPDGGYESTTTVQPPQSGTVSLRPVQQPLRADRLGPDVRQVREVGRSHGAQLLRRQEGAGSDGPEDGLPDLRLFDRHRRRRRYDRDRHDEHQRAAQAGVRLLADRQHQRDGDREPAHVSGAAVPRDGHDGRHHRPDRVQRRGHERSGSIVSCTNSTGSINVTTPGGSSTWTAGNPIVFFNSVIDTTKAGTELNLWPNGLLDATQSTSLHGLATSTAPNWASYTDTSGGRFGFIKLRKGQQYINNYGGTEPDTLILSNGVLNDATAAERAARIYPGVSMFDLDGNLKAKNTDIRTSLLAPPAWRSCTTRKRSRSSSWATCRAKTVDRTCSRSTSSRTRTSGRRR